MYNIDWLILKTLSEEKSISKTAEKLFISQPAITRRLKRLEQELHTTIIIRTPLGINFTSEGIIVLNYAKQALQSFQNLTELLQTKQGIPRGTLQIGVSRRFANKELPEILRSFVKEYPNVKIQLNADLSSSIYKLLQKDEIQLALIRGEYNWNEVKIHLEKEQICLVASHPVEKKDLLTLPFIVPISSIQNAVENWWNDNFQQAPNILGYVDSIDTCQEMVLQDLGWSVLPELGLPTQSKLFKKPLTTKDGLPLLRNTYILYRSAHQDYPPLLAFVSHIKKTFQHLLRTF